MEYIAVVCIDKNYGIGKDGQLLMRLSKDMKRFVLITTLVMNSNNRNVVIMGRKTWDSIPEKFRPLKDRINIVISTTLQQKEYLDNLIICRSPEEAESVVYKLPNIENIFIIGGQSIYTYFMPKYHTIYITEIFTDLGIEADAFFPKFDLDLFDIPLDSKIMKQKIKKFGVVEYQFKTYKRKNIHNVICKTCKRI